MNNNNNNKTLSHTLPHSLAHSHTAAILILRCRMAFFASKPFSVILHHRIASSCRIASVVLRHGRNPARCGMVCHSIAQFKTRPPFPEQKHTHTHQHTLTHTNTHTHTLSLSLILNTHTHTRVYTHTRARARAHTHTRSHSVSQRGNEGCLFPARSHEFQVW